MDVASNAARVKVVVYSQSLTQPPVMATLHQQLELQKDKLESETVNSPEAVSPAVEKTGLTVLILTLHSKEELVDVLNALATVEKRIQTGVLRAIVLNGMNHPRVVSLLRGKGAQEILEFTTPIKTLNYKIKTAFMLVVQAHQRLQQQKATATMGMERAAAKATRVENANAVQWRKAIEDPTDFWIAPTPGHLRFVMGRWLIDLLGPGPSVGFWEETLHERTGERGWAWKIRVPAASPFQPRPGRWIFFGKQPEFSWQKNLWSFVSSAPYLAYYAEEAKTPEWVRIQSLTGGGVQATENSETARRFLPEIQASLEASLKVSKGDADGTANAPNGFAQGGSMDAGARGSLSLSRAPGAANGTWNRHGDAGGVNFQARDLRVPQNAKRAMEVGLGEMNQPAIVSGMKSFERVRLKVKTDLKNGAPSLEAHPLRVIELTDNRASFEFRQEKMMALDRYRLKVEFQLGDVEKKFEIDWIGESVQPLEGGGCFAQGQFAGGSLKELKETLRLYAQRQIELRDFFLKSKGA